MRAWQQMLDNVGSGAEQVVDARPAARWGGGARGCNARVVWLHAFSHNQQGPLAAGSREQGIIAPHALSPWRLSVCARRRWRGEAPEPRAGLASGHIPGSKTLQFANVLQDGRWVAAGPLAGSSVHGAPLARFHAAVRTWCLHSQPARGLTRLAACLPCPPLRCVLRRLKPADQLAAAFKEAGVNLDAPTVATCGTGTTACILVLALQQLRPGKAVAVYDGSWSEWGQLPGVPVATGNE